MNIPLLIVILYVLLLFCISIYVSYSQKKGFRELPFI